MDDNVIRRGVELVAGAAIAAVLTFFAVIYAGRVLGPVAYADFSAALAVIYFVGLALSPVIPTIARVAARHVANGDEASALRLRQAMLRIAAWCAAAMGIAGAVFLMPISRWLRFRSPVPVAFAIVAALFYVVLSIDRGFLQGLFRFRQYNVNIVVEGAVRAVLLVAFLLYTPTAGSGMIAWSLSTIVAQALIFRSLRSPGDSERVDWTEFVTLLRPIALLMVALAIFQNTDVLAVKRWLRPELAGAYAAANAVTRGFGALFVPLYAMAGPLLTRAREQQKSVFDIAMRLTAAYLGIVALPLIAIAIWPVEIVTALYGPKYIAAASVLPALCVITMMSYIALMLTQALITIGNYRFMSVYAGAAAAQVAGLLYFHRSIGEVLVVLANAQGAALLLVTIIFLKSQYTTRAGSISSSK